MTFRPSIDSTSLPSQSLFLRSVATFQPSAYLLPLSHTTTPTPRSGPESLFRIFSFTLRFSLLSLVSPFSSSSPFLSLSWLYLFFVSLVLRHGLELDLLDFVEVAFCDDSSRSIKN